MLGSVWRSFDRQLALAGSTRWYNSLWHFGVYLALFLLTAYSLGIAIMDASYGPLIQVPTNLLLDVHRYLFVGDLPTALKAGRCLVDAGIWNPSPCRDIESMRVGKS